MPLPRIARSLALVLSALAGLPAVATESGPEVKVLEDVHGSRRNLAKERRGVRPFVNVETKIDWRVPIRRSAIALTSSRGRHEAPVWRLPIPRGCRDRFS